MDRLPTDTLAELIDAKRLRLATLRELGRRQLALIEEGDMSALLDLLATKQRSLVELQRIERALDPFRREDPDRRRWRTPEARRRCAEQLDECQSLLEEIIRQEKLGEATLVRRRDQAARQLQDVNQGVHACGAYTAPAGTEIHHEVDLLSGG